MNSRSMTYAELAEAWNVSPEAARKKAQSHRLPRSTGNDRRTRVLVDLEETTHKPLKKKKDRRPPGDRPETGALQEHIATLKAEIDRLIVQVETARRDFVHERDCADTATLEAKEIADRLDAAEKAFAEKAMEALKATHEAMVAVADKARLGAEIQQMRAASRPWWRKVAG